MRAPSMPATSTKARSMRSPETARSRASTVEAACETPKTGLVTNLVASVCVNLRTKRNLFRIPSAPRSTRWCRDGFGLARRA